MTNQTFNKYTQRFETVNNTCSKCGKIIQEGELVTEQYVFSQGNEMHIVCPTREPMSFCTAVGR